MGLLSLLTGSAAFCLGYVDQNVLAVYWTTSSLSPYGVLLVNTLSFPIVFGALALVVAVVYRREVGLRVFRVADHAEQCSLFVRGSQAQTIVWIGFLNALNGLGVIYASPATRTPPIIQAILQNSGALFAVPFSVFLLGDRKRYLSWQPLLAAACFVGSVVVSILPTVLRGGGGAGFDGAQTVAWVAVYLGGLIPGAGYNVCQQRYLIQAGALRAGAPLRTIVVASVRVLFWGCTAMTVFMVALFWVDLLPWFGSSTSLTHFAQITKYSLACSLIGPSAVADTSAFTALDHPECASATPGYAYGFVGGYTVAYIGGAELNRESSTYTMLVFVLVTVLTSAFWFIPGTPGERPTPWAVAVSLVLSSAGMLLWKRWEVAHDTYQFAIEDYKPADAEPFAYDDDEDGGVEVGTPVHSTGASLNSRRPNEHPLLHPGGW